MQRGGPPASGVAGGVGVLVGDGEDAGESALAPAWPLPEKTVVKPLLCGVGFRLFPALISARSSELSPVGDIMLNDLVWRKDVGGLAPRKYGQHVLRAVA